MLRTVYGKYYSIDCCKACEHRLTNRELLYSSATCPYCGNTSTGTVCSHIKKVFRTVKTQRKVWGLFWKTIEVEYEQR